MKLQDVVLAERVVAPVDWPLAELRVVLGLDSGPLLYICHAVEQGRGAAAA